MEVFTPLNETRTERLRFDRDNIELISGNLNRRGRGQKAVVEIARKRYKVIGISCGLPNCACDAYITEVAA